MPTEYIKIRGEDAGNSQGADGEHQGQAMDTTEAAIAPEEEGYSETYREEGGYSIPYQ